jgi:hypothetical protein
MLTDTPQWDISKARARWQTDWVSAIRSLPGLAPGRQVYAEFLCDICSDGDELRFYTSADTPSIHTLSNQVFNQLPLDHPMILRHDLEFLRRIARQYYSIAAKAYSGYLRDVAQCPNIVGYHRCQYIDRPVPAAQLLKQGLLKTDESPYLEYTRAVRRANFKLLDEFHRNINNADPPIRTKARRSGI